MHRKIFEQIGGFSDKGRGYPEDQEFILRHVFEFGGKLHRVDKVLLMYRFHEGCETLGTGVTYGMGLILGGGVFLKGRTIGCL